MKRHRVSHLPYSQAYQYSFVEEMKKVMGNAGIMTKTEQDCYSYMITGRTTFARDRFSVQDYALAPGFTMRQQQHSLNLAPTALCCPVP